MFRFLSTIILRLSGWTVTGNDPNSVPKKLLVVAPHTSSWDFILGLLVRTSTRLKSNYLIKNDYFNGPLKWFFKYTGGHPVDRSKNTRLVDQIVQIFQDEDEFTLAITPEGTRKRVNQFKTGFYHIAHNAEIPVILVKMDYANKQVHFGDPQVLGPDRQKEIDRIEHYFSGIIGKKRDLSFLKDNSN